MKKRIAIFVVLAMVLCLALTGCGQSDKRTDGTGNVVENGRDDGFDFDTGDSSIMDGTNNPGGDSEDYPDGGAWNEAHGGDSTGSIDNTNPKQDASGKYVYTVQGHEIKLRVNIWDYIKWVKVDGVQVDNVLYVDELASFYGYDENYNSNGAYKHKNDDGTVIHAGFEYDATNEVSHITCGKRNSDGSNLGSGAVHVVPYDAGAMDYYWYYVNRPINMDMIILCAYAMEYYADGNQGNCFEEIFGEMSPNLSPYETQQ